MYVYIESQNQTPEEKEQIEKKYDVRLNEDIGFAYPRLQFTNMEVSDKIKFDNQEVYIEKGWADQTKGAGIYVGWGIETFKNSIKFSRHSDNSISLQWKCITADLNYYDERAKTCEAEIYAELDILHFASKADFWKFEKDRIDGKV